MPIDYENNLILYGKDTKCRNHETKIAKKNYDFQSGWGIHSYTYGNLYVFDKGGEVNDESHNYKELENITERETVKSSVIYKFRFSTVCGRRFGLKMKSGELASERYKAKREVVLTF